MKFADLLKSTEDQLSSKKSSNFNKCDDKDDNDNDNVNGDDDDDDEGRWYELAN